MQVIALCCTSFVGMFSETSSGTSGPPGLILALMSPGRAWLLCAGCLVLLTGSRGGSVLRGGSCNSRAVTAYIFLTE